ncbi:MAG: extracellular solute-binding protein [Eubacteriales bacterium]|nr:extracellular solute-binding protein [Eubacteriales bacterium]
MKKKIISLFLAGTMVTGMLAVNANAADAVDLELFSTKSENVSTLQGLIDKFTEANPGVTITITAPSDAGTVLKTRLTKNDIPDIIACGGDATYTELQSAGVLEDLSGEDYLSSIQDAYWQMLYDVNKEKEETAYGVPYATNASGILYNKDIFEQAGVEVPETWTELQSVVDTLEAAGIQPFELTFKDNWTCLPPWNSMAPVIPAANFTDERKAGNTTFVGTHEEILEKYAYLLEHAQKDYMGTTYSDGNKLFAEGNAAMMINGNWAIPEFLNSNADMNVDMFAFPSTDDASKNTITSGIDVLLAVSSQSDDAKKAAAKEFISFMIDAENAQQYIDEQFAFSAVIGVEQTNETVASAQAAISEGKVSNFPDHYYPSGFDLASILSEFALNVTNGMDLEENIQSTLATCDEQYDVANVE